MIKFSRDTTQILKGIALVLMIIHHTIMAGDWVETSIISGDVYRFICQSTKMCVWIFAFLVGFGFYLSNNKTFIYSLKRVTLLTIPFWVILGLIFIPQAFLSGSLSAMFDNGVLNGIIQLIYNMFGISESLNWYSWFVCFYILSICSMPYIHKIIEKYTKYGWIIIILSYYALSIVIHCLPFYQTNLLIYNLFTYTTLFPIIIVGYMCARWNKTGKIPTLFEGKNRLMISLSTLLIVLFIQGIGIPTKGVCLQAFYTPILIFAIVGIFNSFKLPHLRSFFKNIGDLSMYMWFIHAIFFTETVNHYAKHLVFSSSFNCFIYTFIMTLTITYAIAWIIKKMLAPIINKI